MPYGCKLEDLLEFCTTAHRQKLTRLHCSVGVSNMAFCQWDLKFIAYVMGVTSPR